MLVQKFGGSSLADLDSFIAAAAIISRAAEKEKTVVVLSAMYGVTNLLESAINTAMQGGDFMADVDGINQIENQVLNEAREMDFECPGTKAFSEQQDKRLKSRSGGYRAIGAMPGRCQGRDTRHG